MSRLSLGLGVLLTVVAVGSSRSQEPPGPGGDGPRGFGPPMGGFGPPGGGFGFGPMGAAADSAAALLAMPAVQRELGLSDAQIERVNGVYRTLGKVMQESFGAIDFAELPNLSDQQRDKQFAEAGKKTEAAGKAAEESLVGIMEPAQAVRLAQLQVQRKGARALADVKVADRLGLTAEQRAGIEKLVPPAPGGFGGFGPPAPAPAVNDELLAVLTNEQRTKWAELTGARFEFPAPFPGGPGGPGGMFGQTRAILADFDANHDGWLNLAERKAARESLAKDGGQRADGPFGRGPFGGGPFGGAPFGGGGRGPGRRGGRGPGGPFGRVEPGTPGPHVSIADVTPSPSTDLYDPQVVRTLFLEFENTDWEAELEAFHGTDVDVPATMTVDGQRLENVGVRFRGMSSYMMLPTGSKRSLNLSLDLADEDQRLYGSKTLNLLNAHEDPSFLHTVLFSRIAREYIQAPKANLVRVVINGESWGVYVNAQQFDKLFVAENFGDASGSRWKVPGSPRGAGGLEYLGEDIDDYRDRFEIKSDDNEKAWRALIDLCRTLNETPVEELEHALEPMLDIEGALWFLALDIALINSDGYWVRASDYSLYRDRAGKFHVIPHDMNEVMQPPMGPGMGGGRRGVGGGPRSSFGVGPPGGFGGGSGSGGYALDALVGLDDPAKPLRSKLLAVPALRARYLEHVREIAETWLDWDRLGPMATEYAALIEDHVKADTRKLSSFEEFQQALSPVGEGAAGGRHNLHLFAKERRAFLLERDAEDATRTP